VRADMTANNEAISEATRMPLPAATIAPKPVPARDKRVDTDWCCKSPPDDYAGSDLGEGHCDSTQMTNWFGTWDSGTAIDLTARALR
jgi:hypothetical protein